MAKRKLPDHISGTVREWRVKKRRELKAIRSALNRFALGCAFTPARDIHVVGQWIVDQEAKLRGNWHP